MRNLFTEEEKDQIAELMMRQLSAAEIGAEVGRTRNAIISVVHRNPRLKEIGLRGIGGTGGNARRAKASAWRVEVRVAAATSEGGGFKDLVINAEALKPRHCRWVYGDPKVKVEYCGYDRVFPGSYCAHHHGIVYKKE